MTITFIFDKIVVPQISFSYLLKNVCRREIIKNVRNLLKLKKENEAIKGTIIKYIRNIDELEEEIITN